MAYKSEWYKNYKEKNKEKLLEKDRRRNKAVMAARSKEYRDKNKVALAAKKRAKYVANRDEILARTREIRSENSEKVNERARMYRASKPKRAAIAVKKWASQNRDVVNALRANYRAAKRNAKPAWANSFFIAEAYSLARLREKVCGGRWQVDHIVPLVSKVVCGLHVENNLQVIPAQMNIRKSNKIVAEAHEVRVRL